MYNTHRTGSGRSGGGLTTAIGYHVQTKRNSSRPSYYYIVYLYTLLYYIIDCVRHTTGEPGDLLLYSCSRFRVPFIAYTRTHAHKYMSECYKCACVSVYEFFFFVFSFYSFHSISPSVRSNSPCSRARSPDSFSQCPFRNRYNCAADTPRYSPIIVEKSKTLNNKQRCAYRPCKLPYNIIIIIVILIFCRVVQPADSIVDIHRRKYAI